MQRCQSQILGPFKTNFVIFRHSSFLRTSFGCSFYKKKVFLHLGNHKHLRKLPDKNETFFKGQKKFIWTSFYFFKNQKNENWTEFNTTSIKALNENETEKSVDSQCNKNVEDPLKKNVAISCDENKSKIIGYYSNENVNSIQNFMESESDLNNINSNKKILNASAIYFDKYKNKLVSEEKNCEKVIKFHPQENLNLEKSGPFAFETMVLPKKKFLRTYFSISSKDVTLYAETKWGKHLLQICKLSKSALCLEGIKKQEKMTDVINNKERESKRKTLEIDLGKITPDIKLDPPDRKLVDKERHLNQNTFVKETPQNVLLEKAKGILRKTTVLKNDDDNRSVKIVNLGGPKGSLNLPSRRRQTVDLNKCSTERNFITPVRAMTDFLLKPSDLEGLRKTKRRSPYENDPPITVYWRKDVEAKALDVWGSKENLLKEILKRDIERRRYQQNLFTVKRRLRDYRREQGRETEVKLEQNGLFGSSGKVVLTAIAINGTNFLFKLLAWVYTGSHSMFSEAVHSLADTINQLILAYGIHKSVQRADSDHPYGYTNMRYVASLISGVGIFCVGSGLSFYHGFMGLIDQSVLPSFYWAYFILGGSLASEGATLLVAFNSIRLGARKSEMSFSEYVWRGQDPSVNVVLLEDMAAVIGVGFAGCCMGLSSYYDSHIPDAIGSFFVGGLLAGVASFIIYTNVAALVGRSIPQERLDKINSELESDVMIRAIHDVKGIDIGNSLVRYKAEMDFDGGELTRSYLDKQDLNQMLEDVKKMQTIDDLEEFMLKHGENIVDMMGGEIDRIELKLRKKHPEIRHCDLEIL